MEYRRLGAALVAGLVALTLAGCGAPRTESSDKPVVLTTFTVLADIARNVAGEHLQVESITKVGAEIHGYEPTPGDIRTASRADLILDNGLHLEAWFEQFLGEVGVERVRVSDGIEPIAIAGTDQPNPHAWMSPLNVGVYIDNMVAAFSDLDPSHAADYRAHAEAYRAELHTVHADLIERLGQVPPDQRALVTCEGAFSYLARDAGLTERFIWPVNAEQQATPRQIAGVIEFVQTNEVPAVFCESTVSEAAMQRVVEATDAVFGGTLYVDSLSAEDGPVPSYLELIRHDADTIAAALTGQRP